ncbi:MAG: DMT family transporter [Deltaproteobacteria bacterium]
MALNIALLGFIIITWGYSWALMKIGIGYIEPLTFSALRCGLGGACLIPFVLTRRIPLIKRERLGDALAVGLLQTAGMFGFMVSGMKFVTAGKTAVLLYTMAIWTSLIVHFYLKERLTPSQWVGIVFGCAGGAAILGWDTLANQSRDVVFGELLIILGAVCWAASNVWVKKRLRGEDAAAVTCLQLLTGSAALFLVALPIEGGIQSAEWTRESVAIVLFTGVVASAINFTIWVYLINRLDINTAVFCSMLVPVTGLVFDRLMLGTRLDAGVIIGGALILAGIYQVSSRRGEGAKASE